MILKDTEKITILAILSRCFVLLIGKTVSLFFERFDKSSALTNIRSPFKFLESWDTVHYVNISENGYTHEHALPFFPLLPWIARTLNFTDVFTTGIVFNNVIFVFTALVLHRISLIYFGERFSFLATLFFIFNPASVVFSAFYTEGLFTLLFLLGLFYSINKVSLKATIFFALSSLCRSNGTLFIIFVNTLYMPLVVLPFALFQLYSLLLIWKNTVSFKIFVPYSMVQDKYWDQGFLRFFTANNIPNILIGMPTVILAVFFLVNFFRFKYIHYCNQRESRDDSEVRFENLDKENIKNQGNIPKYKEIRRFYDIPISENIDSTHIVSNTTHKIDLILDVFTKLALLLTFQILIVIFCIHWNIALRFISYNPFLYWSAAYFTIKYPRNQVTTAVCTFFAVYGILYVIMFSCFYPPA